MEGSTRAQSSARRRNAILDAALDVFSDNGVDRVTVDDIRQRAGVSVGSLYHHFANKEQIIDALYLRAVDGWQEAVLTALGRGRTPQRSIEHAVDAHLDYMTTNPTLAAVLIRRAEPEDPIIQAELRESYAAFGVGFGGWLTPLAASGHIRRLAPEMYAAIIIGPCMELARNVLAGRTAQPLAKTRNQLAELIWAALKNPSGAPP